MLIRAKELECTNLYYCVHFVQFCTDSLSFRKTLIWSVGNLFAMHFFKLIFTKCTIFPVIKVEQLRRT